MHRARLGAGVALVIAIPLGLLGAWAFNPDTGAVAHSETLWRVFGVMAEGGMFLLVALGVLLAVVIVARRLLTLGHVRGA
jgi:hypothetical protein